MTVTSDSYPMIEFRTLGAVDLRDEGGHDVRSILQQPKRLALLAYLAVARPRGFHRRDILLALLWAELDQQRARGALRKAVHGVRRALGHDTLLGRGDEDLGLEDAVVWCDAVALERALEEQRLSEALNLYRGDFLEGLYVSGAPEFEQWVAGEQAHFREVTAAGAWALADRFEAERQDALAAKYARRALAFTPMDERAFRRFATQLYRMGDRAAVLQEANEFEARLRREYGVRLSAETRRLLETVKASGELLGESRYKGREPPSAQSKG
jgi:DNA-binding SARP family transcriptional activator